MRVIISLFFIVASFLCSYSEGLPVNEIYCSLYLEFPDFGKEKPENPEIRRRIPSAPIVCVITRNSGIEFLTGEKPEIVCYELHDFNDQVYYFSEESIFVEALFSNEGVKEFTLVSEDYNYHGVIY